MHVWSSRAVVCEPRRPGLVGPPGFHTTAREPKCAHFKVPAFKNTTKIPRKDPKRERKKNENCGGRREKKSEILGGLAGGLSGGGLSGGRVVFRLRPISTSANFSHRRGGVQRKGPSEMRCRVRGFWFSSGIRGRKQKQNKTK